MIEEDRYVIVLIKMTQNSKNSRNSGSNRMIITLNAIIQNNTEIMMFLPMSMMITIKSIMTKSMAMTVTVEYYSGHWNHLIF